MLFYFIFIFKKFLFIGKKNMFYGNDGNAYHFPQHLSRSMTIAM